MSHDHEHSHNKEEALSHLRQDGRVLSAIAGTAFAADAASIPFLKTGLSLGGEDAWWVWLNAREEWQAAAGGRAERLKAALSGSKISLSVLGGVVAATPFVDSVIEGSSNTVATATFCSAAVAISSASMIEGYWNDHKAGRESSEYKRLSRRYRKQGIAATYIAGAGLQKYIGDGNAFALAFVGGMDCLYTGFRSWRQAVLVGRQH